MAPHSSTLAWKIPWMEEPGGLQSMGLLGVRHDWTTSLSLFTFLHWRRKWQPTPVFLPENPRVRRAWWADVYGVTQSRTRLKWLSSSSSSPTLWDPMDYSLLGTSVHGRLQQEYWSGFPFPSPGDLPDPGIEPRSPAMQADSLSSEPPRNSTFPNE